jgi:hypothetical protein
MATTSAKPPSAAARALDSGTPSALTRWLGRKTKKVLKVREAVATSQKPASSRPG